MTGIIHNDFSNDYDVVKKIGRGGTADIYLANRADRAQPVVLKRFYDPAADTLTAKEMEIARRVRFPGIARVHRAGKTRDHAPFLEMEYCPGPTLESFPGRLDEHRLLAVLSAAAASLHVLHCAGYVHNDLKPSNIFCPSGFERDDFRIDSPFYLKLADFSLAEKYTADKAGQVTGTVGYMSPEMILKKEITPKSDLFSLGVMAYQLACGSMPFVSGTDDPLEINAMITEGDRPELGGPGKSFSRQVAGLILSLMEANPDKRPSSAFELMERLADAGSPYPFRRSVRPRHLLNARSTIDAAELADLFGEGSFSSAHIRYIERATGFEPAAVRILLEHNFDRDNFARLKRRWGWRTDDADAIEWSKRQIRFSLRPLRGASVSVKQLALAVAVLDDIALVEHAARVVSGPPQETLAKWNRLPRECLPALLHSLDNTMNPATRRILSARLVKRFDGDEVGPGLMGRLLYQAGHYREAVEVIIGAAEQSESQEDHEISLKLLDMALDASRKLGDTELEGTVRLKTASIHKELGDISEAETRYLQTVDLLEQAGHESIIAKVFKQLGDLYKDKSDYAAGINVLHRAQDIYTRLEDDEGLSHTLNNLGNMYWIAGRLDQALEYYTKALDIRNEAGSEQLAAITMSNIGTVHCVKGDYTRGIDYLNQSLEIKKALGNKGEIAQTYNNLGLANFLLGNVGEAIEAYMQALRLNDEIGDQLELLINIGNLAEAMIQAGRLSEALKYLRQGGTVADKLDDKIHRCAFACLTGHLMRRMGYYDDAEDRLAEAIDLAGELDNKSLLLPCHINRAYLHQAVRSGELTEKHAGIARRIAEALGDKNALFHIALVEMQLADDERSRIEAEKTLAELKTPREEALFSLITVEMNNRKCISDGSAEHIDRAGAFFDGQRQDVDQARYHMAAGGYHLLTENRDQARIRYQQAQELAAKLNLLPEQWQAAAALSDLSFAEKDFEKSFSYARQATATLKQIAARIKDSDRLGRFYNDERIVNLLGRIKSLQSLLAKTKGAV